MNPKKPQTVQELIEQLQNWNKRFYERQAKKEIKQKEWIQLSTNLCEVYKKHNTFSFMGYSKPLPEQLSMGFMLTNDHIEREDCKWKIAVFNFDNLNFN